MKRQVVQRNSALRHRTLVCQCYIRCTATHYVTCPRSDIGQPVVVTRVASVNAVEELALEFFRHRSPAAGTNDSAVHLTHGCYFRRGTGEEHLVGNVDIVSSDALFLDVKADVAGQWGCTVLMRKLCNVPLLI